MSKKRVTIKDLAKIAGVSVSTVSRALKDYPDLSQDTKDRIHKLAKEVGYVPNQLAQNLRNSKTYTIGVIIPQVVHYFFSNVISGIIEVAEENNYSVLLTQSSEKTEREKREAQMLVNKQVDGILVSLANDTIDVSHLQEIIDREIPLIQFDKISEELDATQVLINDRKAGYQATRHLIDIGRKKIAHFHGPSTAKNAHLRYLGYRDALRDAGLPFDERWAQLCPNVDQDGGYAATKVFLDLPKEEQPDALFAGADAMAIGAMLRYRENGVKVPEEVAVMGFSDWHMATVMDPPLSSVFQPGFEIGRVAMQELLEEINAPTKEKKIIWLPTELRIRKSTGLSN